MSNQNRPIKFEEMTPDERFYTKLQNAEAETNHRKRYQGFWLAARLVKFTSILNKAEVEAQINKKSAAAYREYQKKEGA